METLTMEKWSEIDAIHDGTMHEVSEEVFDYFLDVLPPVFMNKKFTFKDGLCVQASFGFAEGYEPIVVFWHENDKAYCRQSSMYNRWG